MGIPKIIHYCWFGNKPMPSSVDKYIESWKKYLPDFKIMCWNEENFDVASSPYVKSAYEAGKYAFVSDYARLYALKMYGGVYLDIDVQVMKNFDKLLEYEGIYCFESSEKVMTAFMAASKDNSLINQFLEYYAERKFDLDKLEPNTVPLTSLLVERGLVLNDKNQVLNSNICVFSNEYFNAYDFTKAAFRITENTYTVHHCLGSWCSPKDRLLFKLKHILSHILGEESYDRVKNLKKKVMGEN